MKVLFDTCVVLDALMARKPYAQDSQSALLMATNGHCEGFLTAKSMTDIFYVVHRLYHDKDKSKQSINSLLLIFGLLDTTGFDIRAALNSPMLDFEDAVLAFDAASNHIDYVVTRNKKDFESSPVPVITPDEFLALSLAH
jgi:predicted nucleic acid-binding protein